jgi:hypothetical protein
MFTSHAAVYYSCGWLLHCTISCMQHRALSSGLRLAPWSLATMQGMLLRLILPPVLLVSLAGWGQPSHHCRVLSNECCLCRLVAVHMAQWPDRTGSVNTVLLLMHGVLTPIYMLSCLGFFACAVAGDFWFGTSVVQVRHAMHLLVTRVSSVVSKPQRMGCMWRACMCAMHFTLP